MTVLLPSTLHPALTPVPSGRARACKGGSGYRQTSPPPRAQSVRTMYIHSTLPTGGTYLPYMGQGRDQAPSIRKRTSTLVPIVV